MLAKDLSPFRKCIYRTLQYRILIFQSIRSPGSTVPKLSIYFMSVSQLYCMFKSRLLAGAAVFHLCSFLVGAWQQPHWSNLRTPFLYFNLQLATLRRESQRARRISISLTWVQALLNASTCSVSRLKFEIGSTRMLLEMTNHCLLLPSHAIAVESLATMTDLTWEDTRVDACMDESFPRPHVIHIYLVQHTRLATSSIISLQLSIEKTRSSSASRIPIHGSCLPGTVVYDVWRDRLCAMHCSI